MTLIWGQDGQYCLAAVVVVVVKKHLYGCETRYLTLREEQTVFENRVLRRMFGPER
jgi:hypothetical protein